MNSTSWHHCLLRCLSFEWLQIQMLTVVAPLGLWAFDQTLVFTDGGGLLD